MDEIDKELENSNQLTADRLQELGRSREGRGQKENLLSDDKLRSIMSFLDEVQVSDRLSAVDQVLVLNIRYVSPMIVFFVFLHILILIFTKLCRFDCLIRLILIVCMILKTLFLIFKIFEDIVNKTLR